MNCNEFQNKIIFFIDNELEDYEMKLFESHLQLCETCHKIYTNIQSTYQIITEDKIQETTPFFYARVHATIDTKKRTIKSGVFNLNTRFITQMAASVVVGLLAISAGYFLGYEKDQQLSDTVNENELSDHQLFAATYNLEIASEEVYLFNINELED